MTDILAHIQQAATRLAAIPPAPFLASSRICAPDAGIRFEYGGRQFVLAHPDMWSRVPAAPPGAGNPLFDTQIHDIDVDEPRRDEFFAAFEAVWRP